MDLDPLSFAAPACVKLLLVPVGPVRQSRFNEFVSRLQPNNVVRLGDVSPAGQTHRTFFSPLAFPGGLIIYDLLTTDTPTASGPLSSFEIYRRPLIVAGVLDGADVEHQSGKPSEILAHRSFKDKEFLLECTGSLKTNFTTALAHPLLVFDQDGGHPAPDDGVFSIPSPKYSRTTTIKTLMCDLTSQLLTEMAVFAKSVQSSSTIRTPNAFGSTHDPVSAIPNNIAPSSRPLPISETQRSFASLNDDSTWNNRVSLPMNIVANKISRSSTPGSGIGSPPPGAPETPNTLEETARAPEASPSSRAQSQDRSRPQSRDRSAQNESHSFAERERIRHKGRISLIIGSMYLLAGRWPDAARELVQSVITARTNSDYVWQAKALDHLLVCYIICAWAGMDFEIPEVLRPSSERPVSNSSKSKNSTTHAELVTSREIGEAKKLLNQQALADLLPDVLTNILNLYTRAWTFTEDKILPVVYCQSVIRFAKILTAMRKEGGILSDSILAYIVTRKTSRSQPPKFQSTRSFLSVRDISNLLLRAYPVSGEGAMAVEDRIMILASITSVLSDLGYQRKKALILKEILTQLLPELVQSRKNGAAEMGVHPAASLTSLSFLNQDGIEKSSTLQPGASSQILSLFLNYVCEAYGITSELSLSDLSGPSMEPGIELPSVSSAETSSISAIQQLMKKQVGSQELKTNVIRACINVCEALPDLTGALQYSAKLLRIAGSGIAPGPESTDGPPDLPVEEQVRLANNIARTLSAAQHIGLQDPDAEYWDEFLFRGIEVVETSPSKALIPHARSELEVAETIENRMEKNPFIYNPFAKPASKKETEPLIMANEEAFFRVTLQNLYDIDLHVESVYLEAENVDFVPGSQSIVVGPYRTQVLILGGVAKDEGKLRILGCRAKIRGCQERSFLIFKEPWELKVNVRRNGLKDLLDPQELRTRDPKLTEQELKKLGDWPKAFSLVLQVIKAQPILNLLSISIPQSAIMLLEGERVRFTITLYNSSQHSEADLILLSFNDSATSQLKSTISSKELSEVELYELELAASSRPSFKWLHEQDRTGEKFVSPRLAPGKETSFEIEVFGMPGLSSGTIQIDYGSLGIFKEQLRSNFYTRQLSIPLSVTVNASLDLVRCDLTPLPSDFFLQDSSAMPLSSSVSLSRNFGADPQAQINGSKPLNNSRHAEIPDTPQALLLLDFRNSWPKMLVLHLKNVLSGQHSSDSDEQHIASTHAIAPGTTARIPIPLPKIYLSPERSHAPIPVFNPATARQFIVSKNKHTPLEEIAIREAFWYREELLKNLTANWLEEGTGRTGQVELRSMRLTGRMVAALRLGDIDVGMTVTPAPGPAIQHDIKGDSAGTKTHHCRESSQIKQVGLHRFDVPTSTFLTLKASLLNRSDTPIRAIVRLQPALVGQPHNVALDLGKKLLVNGLLQQAAPVLKPGEKVEIHTNFVILSRGVYEWTNCVEEIEMVKAGGFASNKPTSGDATLRPKAKTGEWDLKGAIGRRIWYGEAPCIVVARDSLDRQS